jgi:hypothetical protein
VRTPGEQPQPTKASRARRPPRAAEGHARPRPFDPRHPLGRLLLALEVDPCSCRHEHPQGATAWQADEECLRWHVRPAAHRLHPDDWLRLLAAWSRQDHGRERQPRPARFDAAEAPTAHQAEEAARQARLDVYAERARRRQRLDCPEDVQRVTVRPAEDAEARESLAWLQGRALLEGVA